MSTTEQEKKPCVYVLFPPNGEKKIEFEFILRQEEQQFLSHFREIIYPPFQGTDTEVLEQIKAVAETYTEIRAGLYNRQWFAIKEVEGKLTEYHLSFPKIDFDKYVFALEYKEFLNKKNHNPTP